VIYGQYPSSAINITADVFAATQLALFAFGTLNKQTPPPTPPTPRRAATKKDADKDALATNAGVDTLYVTEDDGQQYRVAHDSKSQPLLIRI
jgi:hypothetical protein